MTIAKTNGHSKSKIEFSQIHKMFRHEACSSNDVSAAILATKSQAKLSENNKPRSVASPAAAPEEASKD